MAKEKNTSKMIISQILKPEMQIGKQKVTESKRFRPKRRADYKQIFAGGTTELSDKTKRPKRIWNPALL
jgi:hypothetical protein